MITIARDIGGTLEWYAPLRADAGPTVEVVNQAGSAEVAAGTAATLDSVNTTLSAGASAGDTQVTVASGANLVKDYRYLISLAGSQSEFIEVDRFSGTTVYLKNPLAYPHPNASAFQGTRISYALTSAVADTAEENWRMIVSWAVSATSQAPGVVEFTVTRHPIYNPATIPDVFAVASSALRARIAADASIGDALDRAWDEVMDSLQAQGIIIGSVVGTAKAKRVVVYRTLGLLAETYGQAYREERKELADRYAACMALFKGAGAFDEDEDADIEPHEKRSARGGELWRQ